MGLNGAKIAVHTGDVQDALRSPWASCILRSMSAGPGIARIEAGIAP